MDPSCQQEGDLQDGYSYKEHDRGHGHALSEPAKSVSIACSRALRMAAGRHLLRCAEEKWPHETIINEPTQNSPDNGRKNINPPFISSWPRKSD